MKGRTSAALVTVFIVVVAAGCAPQMSVRRSLPKPQTGTHFPIGQTHSVTIGDTMLDHFNYVTISTARLTSVAQLSPTVSTFSLPADLIGTEAEINDETWFLFTSLATGNMYALRDSDGDMAFDLWRGFPLHNLMKLAMPAPFEVADLPAPSTAGVKQEILYQGISGNVLNVSYREFSGDMARPAFTQDVKYTLNSSGPTEVAFRQARLRILSADNEKVTFEVLRGLLP